MPNLKILCNLDCTLFIDGDLVQEVKADAITKVPLARGEYFVEATAILHKDISFREIVLLDYDRFVRIDLLSILLANTKVRNTLNLIPEKDETGHFGYNIKNTNITVIPYQFDEAKVFKGDYGVVKRGEYWGVINKQGEVVLDFDYDGIDIIERNMCVEHPIYSGFVVYNNGLRGFVDTNGEIVVPCQWASCVPSGEYILCSNSEYFSESDVSCLFNYEGDMVYTAERIIPLYFLYPPYLVYRDGLCGVLDRNLKEIVPIQFSNHGEYDSDSENDPLWGIYSREDHSRSYYFKEYLHEDGAESDCYFVASTVLEKRTDIVRIYNYDNIYEFPIVVWEHIIARYHPNMEEYNITLSNDYEGIGEISAYKEILEHKIEITTRDGTRVSLSSLGEIGTFYEELASVCQNNRWSFIDCKGKIICDYKYDKVANFYAGIAVVHNEKGYGVINREGEEIIPCQYKKIYDGSDDSYINLYITVQDDNGDEGIFDRGGSLIVPIRKGQKVAFREGEIDWSSIKQDEK